MGPLTALRPTLGRLLVIAAAAASLAASAATGADLPADRTLTDAQARAGFVYNCAIFIEWPPSAAGADVVIGVVGGDQTTALLTEMQGRKVNGRTIRVRSLQPADDLAGIHILYVAGDDSRVVGKVLMRAGALPVLTVGAQDEFTSQGGVVRLFTEQNRLRFEINMTSAERAGLRVSAKMLGLARIVR